MESRKVSILEQSSRECSTESTEECSTESASNTGYTVEVIIGPSILHFDPIHKSPSDSKNIPSTRLLTSSHPQYSAIGVPVPANGQPIEPEGGEEQRVNESSTNVFSTFMDWYRNAAINFRNSCFIYIIHVLFAFIPIFAVIIGLMFNQECPQTSSLPIFVTVVGAIGVLFMVVGIAVSCYEHHGTPCTNLQKFALGVLFMLFLIGLVIEIILVSHLSPIFDPSDEDYCNKTFYYCIIGKEIMSAAAIFLAALLYLPGSGILTCCQNCSMPSPASAFFGGV